MYSHFSHLRWYCLLLLTAVATIASGQGCPGLSKGDFTVEFDAGNTTCHQPGVVHISYRNAVRGFTKLTYQFSTDRNTYPLAQDALPSERVSVPLDNHWSEGTPIYIRVLAECPGQRVPQSVGLDKLTYTELTASHPQIVATTQSSNGCTGKQGVIRARIGGVTGFSKASYSLYKGTTLACTLFSAKPANYVEFTGLAAGTYRLVAKLTPSCTIGTPPTAPAGATWSGGELTIEKEVVVDAFSLAVQGYSVVGSCKGSVSVAASRTTGINTITCEILPRGGSTPLATETLTAPDWKKTFGSLPAGDYTLHAMGDCVGAEFSTDFTVGTGEVGTLNAWVTRQPTPVCGGGVIQANLPGALPAAPATIRLLDPTSTLVETLTSTGDPVVFKNLRVEGNYTIEAEACGSHMQTQVVTLKSTAQFDWKITKPSKGLCVGGIGGDVDLSFVPRLDQAGKLEVFYGGSLVRTMQVGTGWQKTTLKGLLSGLYNVRLTLDCAEVIEQEFEMKPSDVQYALSAQQIRPEKKCSGKYYIAFEPRLPYENIPPAVKKIFLEGRYEILQGTTIVASGLYSTYDHTKGVEVPSLGKYTVRLIASCGSVATKTEIELKNPTLKIRDFEYYPQSSSCEEDGGAKFTIQMGWDQNDNTQVAMEDFYDLSIEKDGLPYIPLEIKWQSFSSAYTSLMIDKLPIGNYKITIMAKCDHSLKAEHSFTMDAKPFFYTSSSSRYKLTTSPACGSFSLGGLNNTQMKLPAGTSGVSVQVTDRNSGIETYSKYWSKDDLLRIQSFGLELEKRFRPGDYRLKVTPRGYCPSYLPFIYDFTISDSTTPHESIRIGGGTYRPSPTITGTVPCGNTGSIEVGVYDELNKLQNTAHTIKFILTPESGPAQMLTTNNKNSPVKFTNLAGGAYKINMQINGGDCFETLNVVVPASIPENMNVLATVDPVFSNCPRQRGATFRVESTVPDFHTNAITCKVWMWDDATKQYMLQAAKTLPIGQLETYFPNIPTYTGTQASNESKAWDSTEPWPYMLTAEICGTIFYKSYAPNTSIGSHPVTITHTNVTLAKQGTITISPYTLLYEAYKTNYYAIGQQDKIEWTIQNTAGTETLTKIVKATDSYTFTGVPEGTYTITGTYQVNNCNTTFPVNTITPDPTIVIKPGTVYAKITGVNGDCDANAQLRLALQDPTGVTKVTYIIKNTTTGVETVISSTTPAVEEVVTGLGAAIYEIKVESEVPTGATLSTYTDKVSVTLTTSSPYMTIVQDVKRTRPSFKNCRTGYLAFRFQDDNSYINNYFPEFIDDSEYHFRIIAAPPGVHTPQDITLDHPYKQPGGIAGSFHSSYGSYNITPMRNLPAGQYKVEVTNRCKTAIVDCEIPEIEEIPQMPNLLNGNCLLSSSDFLFVPRSDGRYYANPWQFFSLYSNGLDDSYRYQLWNDLLTFDFHAKNGMVLSDIPYPNLLMYNGTYDNITTTYNFRPWLLNKITVKAKGCSSVPERNFPIELTSCGGRYYCGNLIVGYDLSPYKGFENFALVLEEKPTRTWDMIQNKWIETPGAQIAYISPYSGGLYDFGPIARDAVARVITSDGHMIFQEQMTIEKDFALVSTQEPRKASCNGYHISVYYKYASCQRRAYISLQKDDATHTEIERSALLLDDPLHHISRYWYPKTRLQYGENYTLVFMDEHGTELATSKFKYDSPVFPIGYKFSNYCEYSNTDCQNDKQGNNICSYIPRYVEPILPYGYGRKGYSPSSPAVNENWYFDTDIVFTLQHKGRTYTGKYEDYLDRYSLWAQYAKGIQARSTWWVATLDASGQVKTYSEPHSRLVWSYQENGLTYYDTPRFNFGESFTVTATSPTCGTMSVPGSTHMKGTLNVSGSGTWQQTCTGWEYTPPSMVIYKDERGTSNYYSVYQYRKKSSNDPWTDVSTPLVVPKTTTEVELEFKGSYDCSMFFKEKPIYKDHYVKNSESVSYFCSSSNKGQIYVAGTSGNPPYRFELLDGDEESSPVAMTLTSPNESPVLFEYGDVGKKYRINVYDKCNNLRIAYHTTVVSTGDLAYQLSGKKEFCAEENMDLVGQYIPGATYTWTLPDGSTRSGQILYLGPARTALAGRYTIDILPPNCASHITSTYDVTVKGITQPAWFAPSQTICQGNPVTYAPGSSIVETKTPTTTTPGTPKYQWQMAVGTGEFTDIAGATHESYTYPADMAGTYRFRRMTIYDDCSSETNYTELTVNPGPSQAPSTEELNLMVRKGKPFTLTAGYTQTGGIPVHYKWERSLDGSTWTIVGTNELYTETGRFRQREVYYRRTIAPQSGIGCQSVTPTITVTFKGGSAARINPHLRLRVPE